MPHQCTTCGRTFPDGSKEMLSGCPDCGGNKFQFKPAGATTDEPSTPAEQSTSSQQSTSSKQSTPSEKSTPSEQSTASEPPTSDATERSSPTPDDRSPRSGGPTSTGDPASTDPSSTSDADPSSAASDSTASDAEPPEPTDSATGSERVRERDEEDVAQASARSDVVSSDELDQASRPVDSESDADARGSGDPDGPRPDIGELRDELNEQFESIRIVSPGKYELNLMELYDRQEYIISLQEDGRYVIEMPDAWGIQDE